jgi:putative hydrolase of HD superfamily
MKHLSDVNIFEASVRSIHVVSRCLKMALIHDLAECKVGDITPHCGVSADVKHKMEMEAMKSLGTLLPDSKAEEFQSLFMVIMSAVKGIALKR